MSVLRELLDAPPPGYWLSDLEGFQAQIGAGPVSDEDISAVQQRFRTELQRGRTGRAVNWLIAGIIAGPEQMIEQVIDAGSLRASNYDYNAKSLAALVRATLEVSTPLKLTPENIRYLSSVQNLLGVTGAVEQTYLQLRRDILRAGPRGIRSLLAFVDLLFARRHQPEREDAADEWNRFTIEELGEAFSYCYFIYMQSAGADQRAVAFPTDTGAIRQDDLGPLLTAAAKIRQYREWEILLETRLYECVPGENRTTVVVRAVDPALEKGLRFGFIQTQFAKANAAREFEDSESVNEDTVVEDLHRTFSRFGFFQLVTHPIRRITLNIPAIPELVALFTEKGLLRDEAAYLRYAERQYLIDAEVLVEKAILGMVTGWDLLRAWRGIRLLARVMWRHLDGFARNEPDTMLASLVPVFRTDVLESLIGVFVGDQEKAHVILDHLSWDPASQKIFDVQYFPFIRAGEWIGVPMNIAGGSDWLRNVHYLYHIKLKEAGQADPAEVLLHKAFESVDIPARQGRKYRYGSEQWDIDVLAVHSDRIFFFECKTVYLPVNAFELRRTLREMDKAASQLDRACRLAADQEFIRNLRASSGLAIHPDQRVVSAIVLTNRMFSGVRYRGHAVRGLRELGSFVASGSINVGDEKVQLISGDIVTGEELEAYINQDMVHAKVFGAMVSVDRVFPFGRHAVTVASYALDAEALQEQYGILSAR